METKEHDVILYKKYVYTFNTTVPLATSFVCAWSQGCTSTPRHLTSNQNPSFSRILFPSSSFYLVLWHGFNPTSIGPPPNWSLTDFSDLKGCACKVSQEDLQKMLAELNLGDGQNLGTADGRIALDCSIRRTRQGHYVISTTDFLFPLDTSPYLQGRIGAANVLSDLYASHTMIR